MCRLRKLSVPCLAVLGAACGADLSAPDHNVPPVAAFGSSCAERACTFSDSSIDADGRIAAYRWSFGDGSSDEASRDAGHTYAAVGAYPVVLTVTDDKGATSSATRVIQTILPPNTPPVVSFGSACVDLTCTFVDSSSDVDGTVVSRHWAFGDGAQADTTSPAHTYASAGSYVVGLAVTDDRGAKTSSEREVTVTAPAPPGPAIAVSDNSILFCYAPGSTRNCVFLMEDVRITSTGSALRWTASSDQPWIVLSRTQGTTPSTVRVSVGTLPPRSSQVVHGTITLRADGATNSPLTVPVGLSFVAIRPGQ